MCHAACESFAGLMTVRFFLGVGEAALAPGFALITGMFYTRKEQPLRQGAWFIGNAIANMFGGLVAYGVGNITTSSMEKWRLLFIILGSVTAGYAFVLLWLLPDSPSKAIFLNEHDRQVAVQRTLTNKTGVLDNDKFVVAQVWEAFLDPQTYGLFFYTAAVNIANGGSPSLQFGAIVIAGFGFSDLKALLIQMPMGATQLVFLLLTSGLASFLPSCRIALMISNTLMSMAGMIMVYAAEGKATRMAGLCLGSVFATNIPLSLSLISSNVGGFTKRSVISATLFVAYCVGNIIGPQFFLASQEPKYQTGLIASVSGLAIGVLFLIALLFYYIWENRRRDRLYGVPRSLSTVEELEDELSNKTDKQLHSFRYVL
jgi:tetrahydromethanopterin S-methyltransferase subunit F